VARAANNITTPTNLGLGSLQLPHVSTSINLVNRIALLINPVADQHMLYSPTREKHIPLTDSPITVTHA
jgi:hypothetical protein